MYDPFHPAVLQAIQTTIAASHGAGKWTGMCGELASDPLATPLLLGMGLDEFSASPGAILQVKQRIRETSMEQAREIAARALELETAAQVRAYLQIGHGL